MIETLLPARQPPTTLPRAQPHDTPLRRDLRLAPRLRRLRDALMDGARRSAGVPHEGCC